MYYINNKTYACHIAQLSNILGDMSFKGFKKREITLIAGSTIEETHQDNSFVILSDDGLLQSLERHNITVNQTPSGDWIKDLSSATEKNIICFYDEDLLNNIVFSYYMNVSNLLKLSKAKDVVFNAYPALKNAKKIKETFPVITQGSRGISLNLLISSMGQLNRNSVLRGYFDDKINSSKGKMALTELSFIVNDNFHENKIGFKDTPEVLSKILALRKKQNLTMSDWNELSTLILRYPEGSFSFHGSSTVQEVDRLTKIIKTSPGDASFSNLYVAAINDGCKYFRKLDLRTNYVIG